MLERLARRGRQRYVPAFYSAALYAGLKDNRPTEAWLRKARDERCDYMVHLSREPTADAIRDQPWFQELVPRVKQAAPLV